MQETSNQREQLHSEIKTVKSDNQKLHEQLQIAREELQKPVGNSLAPDYEAIRDRTLGKLKMGRQSPVGKAIQAFIKEIMREYTAT